VADQAAPSSYTGEKVFLLPYSPSQPPFNTSASELQDLTSYLYKRTKDESLLQVLFTGMEQPSKDRFIHILYDKPLLVAFLKNTDPPEPIGYGWLHSIEISPNGFKKASFAFCFFRSHWGGEEVREAGRLALRWWFTELGVTVLFGPTLRRNLLAQNFAREMGFRKVAEIPMFFCGDKELEDCVIVMMSKQEFWQLYGEQERRASKVVEIPTGTGG
jgi:RimJ/RimL family protein N-acetyltransferase